MASAAAKARSFRGVSDTPAASFENTLPAEPEALQFRIQDTLSQNRIFPGTALPPHCGRGFWGCVRDAVSAWLCRSIPLAAVKPAVLMMSSEIRLGTYRVKMTEVGRPPAGGVDGCWFGFGGARQRGHRRVFGGLGARRRQRVPVCGVRREQRAHACAVQKLQISVCASQLC